MRECVPIEVGKELVLPGSEISFFLSAVPESLHCAELAGPVCTDLGAGSLYAFDIAVTFDAHAFKLGIGSAYMEGIRILALVWSYRTRYETER